MVTNWTVNGGPVSNPTKADLKIPRNQTWPFTAPKDLVMNLEGDVVVKAWVSLPNGLPDENHSNDTLIQAIQVIEKYPERHILIEEFTGPGADIAPGHLSST